MPQPSLIADAAPDQPFLTGYDMDHLVTYLRLLDADAEAMFTGTIVKVTMHDRAETPSRH
jgi:hypothetical protein